MKVSVRAKRKKYSKKENKKIQVKRTRKNTV